MVSGIEGITAAFYQPTGEFLPGYHRRQVMAEGVDILTDATFDEEVAASDVTMVVDFWAEWCGPCRMVAPILEQIAAENVGKVRVWKLNVDDNPKAARDHKVMSIPTMIVFKDGVAKKRIVGAMPKASLMRDLAEFL